MLAAAPQSLLNLVRRGHIPRAPGRPIAAVALDTPAAIARAIAWLESDKAPEAIEGDSGNPTTFRLACRVKDFGLSPTATLDVLLDHWNETKAFPSWAPDELEALVANAFEYGTNPPGAKTAEAEFDVVEIDEPTESAKPPEKIAPLEPTPVNGDDLRRIPPRQWVYGHKILRRYVTFLAAQGGAGKTAWIFAMALAAASGRDLLHDEVKRPLRVWIYNLEDDRDELRRRLAAAVKHYALPAETLDNLWLDSGRDRPFKIVRLATAAGGYKVLPDFDLVIDAIRRRQIDVLVVDPYLRSHGVPENDNEAQDEVMRLYAQIAETTNCGVVLVHHTKKGAIAGDMDGMRGGSTQGGGARGVYLMDAMTADEAAKLGVPEAQRRLYVRVSNGKANFTAPATKAEWIKLHGVDLDNADEDYPEGDNVQVATRWEPPDALDGMSTEEVNEALAIIGAGLPDGERYSPRPQDERWAGKMLQDNFMRSEVQAKNILAAWFEAKLIEVQEYKSPSQRRTRKGIFTCVSGEIQ